MFNHELYASALARAVELMRTWRTTRRDEQKASLRAIVALAELSAASLRLYEGTLSVDDVAIPDNVPHVPVLIERMQAHQVAEFMVGRQSDPAEVLALLRGLAAEADQGPSIKERLRDVRSKRIMVILEQTESSGPRHSVSGAFDLLDVQEAAARAGAHPSAPAPAPPSPPAPAAARASEHEEVLKEWDELYAATAETPVRGIQIHIEPEEPAVTAEGPPAEGERASGAAELPRMNGAAEPIEAQAPPPLPMSADTPLGAALGAVVLDPYGGALLDRLTALSQEVGNALRDDQTEAAVRALAIAIDLEPGAPEGTARNSYGIVLKRSLTRELLVQVAQCLLSPALAEAAGKVMTRGRADGAEVLLGLLATAESLRERKAYMTVLRNVPDATDRVIAMLGHHQWFVVRNVAEVLGEQGAEEAVPELGKLLVHYDQRVQRAAAIALAKIGSAATVEPLRRTLREGTPELRSLIAASIGGPRARALAMPLVSLIESETNPDVLKEYYRALGRIRTPDAIQALANAASPGGKLLGRKSTALRLAAVEGLRLSNAYAALGPLTSDSDKAVREAAQAALKQAQRTAAE